MKWILSLGFLLSINASAMEDSGSYKPTPLTRLSASYEAGLPDNVVTHPEPRPSTPVPWNETPTAKVVSPVQPRLSLKTKVAIATASAVGVVALGGWMLNKK